MEDIRKVGDLTVNDGKGFMDNEGLIQSLIVNLNDLIKCMAVGQYIQFAGIVAQMGQKLANLKKGVRNDREDLEEQIKGLKRLNNELAEKAFGMPAEDGGKEDGPAVNPEEKEGI